MGKIIILIISLLLLNIYSLDAYYYYAFTSIIDYNNSDTLRDTTYEDPYLDIPSYIVINDSEICTFKDTLNCRELTLIDTIVYFDTNFFDTNYLKDTILFAVSIYGPSGRSESYYFVRNSSSIFRELKKTKNRFLNINGNELYINELEFPFLIEVYDLNGRKLKSSIIDKSIINIELNFGIYYIYISKYGIIYRKIIKIF